MPGRWPVIRICGGLSAIGAEWTLISRHLPGVGLRFSDSEKGPCDHQETQSTYAWINDLTCVD
jgi:hypothetical protein